MLAFMLANLVLSIVVLGGLFCTVKLATGLAADRGRGHERLEAGRTFTTTVSKAA